MMKNKIKKLYELKPTLDKARHILKSLSYRIYSTCITITIAYLISDDLDKAMSIGAVDFSVKLFTYYIHERIWFYIPFGLQRPRKIHADISWEPDHESWTQVAFIQSEQGKTRKRAKILTDGHGDYRALLSFYNSDTKERFNDILSGTKEYIENNLKIKI
jgi:uncharacterized membrane protein